MSLNISRYFLACSSVGEAKKAGNIIEDCRNVAKRLNQVYSNVWETESYCEDIEEERDEIMNLIYDIEDLFKRAGVYEYDVTEVEDNY